jgi:hypothetical protein
MDLFPSLDPSGDFGRDEGIATYAVAVMNNPDQRIKDVAKRAARVAMILNHRFDVDPNRAAQAIIDDLIAGLPDPGEADIGEQ